MLTQSQIDALFAMMAGGEVSDESVEDTEHEQVLEARLSELQEPKIFTDSSIGIIDDIFREFARREGKKLTGQLGENCELRILGIEEHQYFEFSNALNDSDLLIAVDFYLNGGSVRCRPMLMQIPRVVVALILDRAAENEDVLTGVALDSCSAAEMAMVKQIIRHAISLMNDAWRKDFDVSLFYSHTEESARMMTDISIGDAVVIVTLKLLLRGSGGSINICIPGESLQALFKPYDAGEKVLSSRNGMSMGDDTDAILFNLGEGQLELSAIAGETMMSLGEVIHLRVGDTIRLDRPLDADALLYVENSPCFTGEFSAGGQNVGFRIKGTIGR